jgi:hypothetical protein
MPNCPYCSSVLLPHLRSPAHLYYFCQECRLEVPESMVQLQMAQQTERESALSAESRDHQPARASKS